MCCSLVDSAASTGRAMTERIELVAHRGGRGLFPENTLAAFQAAIGLGVDALELDIAVTNDRVPVVSHDPCLNPDIARGPDGAWLNGPTMPIRALRMVALGALDVGRIRPGSAYAAQLSRQRPRDGERIPSLAQVFALAPSARFYVELKTFPDRPDLTVTPDAMADLVVATAAAAGVLERLVVQSFDWRALRYLRCQHPAIARGYITERSSEGEQRHWWNGAAAADHAGSVARAVAAEGGGTWVPECSQLRATEVQEAHALGLRVVPWGADTAAEIARLADWNVDGLITDYPDIASRVLGRA
jgi:glycerophosphoryl diester phosphodiesterase